MRGEEGGREEKGERWRKKERKNTAQELEDRCPVYMAAKVLSNPAVPSQIYPHLIPNLLHGFRDKIIWAILRDPS